MNAIYLLGPRLNEAKRWGKETLAGGGLNNKQFNDYMPSGPLTEYFRKPDTVWTPRVLKDGSDSVGALGALNRVYLNIGTFSEEWLLHFNALVGGKPITPIEISVSRANSAYFKATEAQTPAMAAFFLKTTGAHHLQDAPGGEQYLTKDKALLDARQSCLRGNMRALPFEQAASRGARTRPERLQRQRLSDLLEQVLGLDARRPSSKRKCERLCWLTTFWLTTIFRPSFAFR